MRKNRVLLIFIIMSLLSISVTAQKREIKTIPIPTQAQLNWQQSELVALFSYDLHVFDGVQYNQAYNRITPIPDINIFNPDQLDTDQWIRSVKDMGAKIAIITATHETGFALYQSDANPYCMKALKWKDGKGDIVRDFVNSCRKFGIQPGIYIGIRWNSFMGVYDFMMPNDGTVFQKNRQAFYNKMCEDMTKELMTRYGDLAIVWYDGGGHGPELGGADILPIVEKYQQNILFYHNSQRADIRWGGSETGTVAYPCWGTFTYPYSHSKNQELIFKDNFRLLKTGNPDGAYYMPAMSDAPLRGYNGRHEWFWEPDDEAHVFPLENLMNMYYKSVGRNSTLILGITPDPTGRVPESDATRMREFGAEINARFSKPLAETKGNGNRFELKFSTPTLIRDVIMQEDIRFGERVRQYRLEGRINGKWALLAEGSCIGHKRIEQIEPITVSAIRLRISQSLDTPMIANLSVY